MNDQSNSGSGAPPAAAPPKPPAPVQASPVHAPNVQFVGKTEQLNKKTGKLEQVPREAPRKITDGETRISLPDSDEQRKGFYSKHAAQLIALFPDDYKIPVDKGGER